MCVSGCPSVCYLENNKAQASYLAPGQCSTPGRQSGSQPVIPSTSSQPASESDSQNPLQACNYHLLWGERRLFADNHTAKPIQKHRHMRRMCTGMPKGCINRCVPVHTLMQEQGRTAEQMWRRNKRCHGTHSHPHTHTQALPVLSTISVKCHHLLMAVMTVSPNTHCWLSTSFRDQRQIRTSEIFNNIIRLMPFMMAA